MEQDMIEFLRYRVEALEIENKLLKEEINKLKPQENGD